MLKLTLQREEVKSAKHALKTTGEHLWGGCKDNSIFRIINSNKSSGYKPSTHMINEPLQSIVVQMWYKFVHNSKVWALKFIVIR